MQFMTGVSRFCRKVGPILLLAFLIQGCSTPLIDIDMNVGKCAPGTETEVGVCAGTTLTAQETLVNALGNSVTCNAGWKKCNPEGALPACARLPGNKKCTTVEQTPGQHNCVCQCK